MNLSSEEIVGLHVERSERLAWKMVAIIFKSHGGRLAWPYRSDKPPFLL